MDETLAREVSNALWRPITRGLWRGPRSTRDLNDYGDKPTIHSIAGGTVPKAPSMNAIITQAEPGAISTQTLTHHVVLFQERYRHTIRTAPILAREDWNDAIDPRNAVPTPYVWQTDGTGAKHLIKTWDPYLVPHVYRILAILASLSTIWPLQHDTPRELIRDEEIPTEASNAQRT